MRALSPWALQNSAAFTEASEASSRLRMVISILSSSFTPKSRGRSENTSADTAGFRFLDQTTVQMTIMVNSSPPRKASHTPVVPQIRLSTKAHSTGKVTFCRREMSSVNRTRFTPW